MTGSRRQLLAGGAATALFGAAALAGPVDGRRCDMLVIMADDLGFSDIQPFGSEISTPHLSALARQGCLMTATYGTPMPHTSHAEFLFGVDHHEIVDRFSRSGATSAAAPADVQPTCLLELMRRAGYRTYMIGTWDSGSKPEAWPGERGAQRHHALLSMAGDYYPPDDADVPAAKESFRYVEDGEEVAPPAGYITDVWTDRLISWLLKDRGSEKPIFAYAAYTAPHFPLQAPDLFISRQRGRYDRGYDAVRLERIDRQRRLGLIPTAERPAEPVPESLGYPRWESLTSQQRATEARRMEVYAAMIENLDWNVGRLLAALKELGRYDNTLVVFTSTNGAAQSVETHRDHSGIDNSLGNMGRKDSWIAYSERWAEVSNAPFARWKAKATEGGITVPTIVRLPRQRMSRPPNNAVQRIRDLPATLLHMAGESPPAGWAGVSLLPLWQGRTTSAHARDELLIDEHRDEAYVRLGPWKAVLISDTAINAFDGSDPANAPYLAAIQAGDFDKAAALRARRPSRWKLYNIDADRGETDDLGAEQPQILQTLIAQYDHYRRRQP